MSKPRIPGPAGRLALVFGVAVVALTGIRAVPIYQTRTRTVTETPNPTTGAGSAGPTAISTTGAVPVYNAPAAGGLECAAGRNGGVTDVGVTGKSIKLAATVVRTGIGASFLKGAPTAMQAMADRVNRAGGICGRQLNLILADDAWDRVRGANFLTSFVEDQKVFALAVVPSSEGLDAVVERKYIRTKGVPVVGSDGMLRSQYKDPWVWPVAASTVSSMHIMVQKAFEGGARTFGIVFDKDYKFGVEGAFAFEKAVERITGKKIPGFRPSLDRCEGTFCGISAGQLSYPEANKFNSECQKDNPNSPHRGSAGALPSCDLVALLLDPTTALTWLVKSHGVAPQGRTMGPQPLFSRSFAQSCGRICQNMIVWTSFNPPHGAYASSPGVSEFVRALKSRDPSADIFNSFTEGAYLGMKLLVDAIARVGPKLTRAALRDVLDSQIFDFGLSPPLRWSPGNHIGSGRMQGYAFKYSGNSFTDFVLASAYVKDRWLGLDL